MLSQRLKRLGRGLRQDLALAARANLPLTYAPTTILELADELERCSSIARGLEQFPVDPLPPGTQPHDVHPGPEREQ